MQWKGLDVILTTKVFMPNQAVIKNLPANAGDMDSIPGLGRPLEYEMATHSSVLAWKTRWTEEPGWAAVRGVRVGLD